MSRIDASCKNGEDCPGATCTTGGIAKLRAVRISLTRNLKWWNLCKRLFYKRFGTKKQGYFFKLIFDRKIPMFFDCFSRIERRCNDGVLAWFCDWSSQNQVDATMRFAPNPKSIRDRDVRDRSEFLSFHQTHTHRRCPPSVRRQSPWYSVDMA